jgi:hypothetical protein
MMMRVHQPRRHQAAAGVDDRAAGLKPLTKLDDFAAVDPDIGVPKLRPGVVHGDDAPRVADQEITHSAHVRARSASASAWSAALDAASTRPPPWAGPPCQSVTTPPAASITAMGAQMS